MRLGLAGLFCACGAFAQVTGDNIITSFAGAAWTFPDGVAGDTLTIYCTGLSALDAAVDAATAASATPPNVKNPVSVTVGDAKAAVSPATLVAGYTGMYQVRITSVTVANANA